MHQWACSIINKEFKLGSVISILSISIKFYLCLPCRWNTCKLSAEHVRESPWSSPHLSHSLQTDQDLNIYNTYIRYVYIKHQIRGFSSKSRKYTLLYTNLQKTLVLILVNLVPILVNLVPILVSLVLILVNLVPFLIKLDPNFSKLDPNFIKLGPNFIKLVPFLIKLDPNFSKLGLDLSKLGPNTIRPLKIYILDLKIDPGDQNLVKI